MYRLLIADDEALEREGLEWIIARFLPGLFEIMHAENGRIAIQLAEQYRPDIVLMDVKMPGIQGLEALEEIKASNPQMKTVLVTAYDYFAYAKQAITLGVKDYIVKPAKKEQVVATLQKLVQELDQEKIRRSEELELRDKCSRLLPLVENEMALLLMMESVQESSIGQMADILEMKIDKGCAVTIAFPQIESVSPAHNRLRLIRYYDGVKNYIKSLSACIISPIMGRYMTVFLVMQENEFYSKGEMIGEMNRLVQWMSQTFGIKVTIGLGALQNGLEELRLSYRQAAIAAGYGEAHQIQFVTIEDVEREAERKHIDWLKRDAPIGFALRPAIQAAFEELQDKRVQETLSVIERARLYIQAHFQEELLMEDVANHVHLNPFYFSKIFKQQVGETFIDYVTGLRISLARQYIAEGELSLKEVCYKVGYRDPNYFSRVFKKVTGVTPTDYRMQGPKE